MKKAPGFVSSPGALRETVLSPRRTVRTEELFDGNVCLNLRHRNASNVLRSVALWWSVEVVPCVVAQAQPFECRPGVEAAAKMAEVMACVARVAYCDACHERTIILSHESLLLILCLTLPLSCLAKEMDGNDMLQKCKPFFTGDASVPTSNPGEIVRADIDTGYCAG
jgi:hypothetical protein